MLVPLVALLLCGAPPSVAIHPTENPLEVKVAARTQAFEPGASINQQQGERLLRLSVVDGDRVGAPITGRYTQAQGTLVFTPKRSLSAGLRYRATLSLPGAAPITVDYLAPSMKHPTPTVVQVFPSTDVLPANQLKFYLHFSESMREGRAIFERIHLLDASGQPVEDPWRRKELWSEDGRRLSLWIHPGRIKQGVNLREEIGPVLTPGKRYTLQIDTAVCSAAGEPLAEPFQKKFTAGPTDHSRPLPTKWKLSPVAAGTREALQIDFGEPLDQSLAQRLIEIVDPSGAITPGRIKLTHHESIWRFEPTAPWSAEPYTLRVDPLLEDLGGNTPLRVFDTDLTLPAPAAPVLRVKFTPVGDNNVGGR